MALTKQDLQAIKNIVQMETKSLATKGELTLLATKKELDNLATKKDLELLATKKELKLLATKKALQKIDKKFDRLFDFHDKNYLKVQTEVRDIQKHLHLPVAEF